MALQQGTLESVKGASVTAGESERVLLAGQVHGGCRSWRESFHGNVQCDGRFDPRPRRFCARSFQKCAPPVGPIPTPGFRPKPMSTQSGSEFNGPPCASSSANPGPHRTITSRKPVQPGLLGAGLPGRLMGRVGSNSPGQVIALRQGPGTQPSFSAFCRNSAHAMREVLFEGAPGQIRA
jgi:hypothetical protein